MLECGMCLKWEEWWWCLLDIACVVLEQNKISSIYVMYNFAIYFHIFDRLKQSRVRGERHPGRHGCCLVLVIIHPGNASQLERSFWNSYFCVHFRFFPETKHKMRINRNCSIDERCFWWGNKIKNMTSAQQHSVPNSAVQCDPFCGEGRTGQCNSNVKIPKCNNNGCSILLRIHQQNLWNL